MKNVLFNNILRCKFNHDDDQNIDNASSIVELASDGIKDGGRTNNSWAKLS